MCAWRIPGVDVLWKLAVLGRVVLSFSRPLGGAVVLSSSEVTSLFC